MRSLLVDLHKTDGMLQVNGWQISNDEVRDIYYAQVLEKHGTTQAQFDSSLVWYTAHPQFFNKIYPKVLKELEAEFTKAVSGKASEQESNSIPGNGESQAQANSEQTPQA